MGCRLWLHSRNLLTSPRLCACTDITQLGSIVQFSLLFCLSIVQLRAEVNEQHEGKRKNEAQWPVFQINWQRSRYVYDMHYVYKAITKDVIDYCIRNVRH